MTVDIEMPFTDEEIRMFSDEKLIDQLVCAGGSEAGFSPYAEKLKTVMLHRLRSYKVPRQVGWGAPLPSR